MLRTILSSWCTHKAACGHDTKLRGIVRAFESTTHVVLPFQQGIRAEYCLACLRKHAIQCPFCRQAVFYGDPVSLRELEGDLPNAARWYCKREQIAIGCVREVCQGTVHVSALHWFGPRGVMKHEDYVRHLMRNVRTNAARLRHRFHRIHCILPGTFK